MTTKDIVFFTLGSIAILFFANKARQTTELIKLRDVDTKPLRSLTQ